MTLKVLEKVFVVCIDNLFCYDSFELLIRLLLISSSQFKAWLPYYAQPRGH